MSIIIKVFCQLILQVTLLLSILFLLRGHNYPGGGFIGALVACTGIGFYILAYKRPPSFILKKHTLCINIGITCLTTSLVTPLFLNKSMLTGLWWSTNIFSQSLKVGTPLLFDIGIYLSILGSLIWIMTHLESDPNA